MSAREQYKPLLEDKSYLRHFWHPVCTLAEFERSNASGHGPMGVTLLGEKLVLARLNSKLVASPDRCAHRSAQLSIGRIAKCAGKDTLQCPYHGWQYDEQGACKMIPACPDKPVPSKAKLTMYDCEVKYEIVWVRLDNSYGCTEIPFLGDWDNPKMQVIVADSYIWNTVAERRWENFTDFSHFAFVHPGTLYDPFFASHPLVLVNRVDGELQFELSPPKEMEGIPEEAPMGDFIYRCTMPYSINLEIKLWRDGSRFILWTTACPIDDKTCRNFMVIIRERDNQPDHVHLAFQKRVLAEDQPIIESQWPAEVSANEISVATDKVSIQYRKWHRELSLAAPNGKEAFHEALRTNVIDETAS
ncbi:aromatic ring-hydroxylating dioxygenase subunit alpha [Burkholderia vietnamiensis]|uniref:aromatic ring-hydroxylating oxygenase subunit alpha n=1 Tax=Burkholderia vietnamiensis TaxID=60552 RepID=UPI0026570D50|nr:aromatic ring-hydroxylating dioxygenase subunit alpha [Burkholderia vietnamiensis]MDN7407991.1 aromatic ring-hydroxylating dioxygenase subunit alpha [Burkholderia vietnamiensis]